MHGKILKIERTRYIRMQIIKYFILFLILVFSSMIGKFISKRYVYRLQELEEMKNTLNILKNKIKFTYEPIPDIFKEISNNSNKNIGQIYKKAEEKMEKTTADVAWEQAVDNNLKEEDKNVLKMLSKLLGQTDTDGQISQIEITENFLEGQIKDAMEAKQKNERLYTRLGTIVGLAIVIVLC